MTLSEQNRLLKVYRWFNRRRIAISNDYWHQQAIEKQNQTTRKHGAQINICPIVRMSIFWGPFLIFPAWLAKFILVPVIGAAVVYAVLAWLGYRTLDSTWLGHVSGVDWLFWSPVFAGISVIIFSLAVGGVFAIGGGIGWFNNMIKRKEQGSAEHRALPVVGTWLKGLVKRLCPTVIID